MIRVVTGGLIVLPFVGLLLATAAASTEFADIPFLQVRINQVLEHEPTGAEVEWHNEATGNSGVIRVLKTYFPEPGKPCRDYERSTRDPEGGETLVQGTGCRDASGRWNLKEKEDSEAPAAPREGAAVPSGGQAGATGGAAGTQSKTAVETGGTGQAAGTGPSQAGEPTSVAPKDSQAEAASEAAAGTSTPAAEKPAEPAKPTEPAKPSEPSPPDYDLPTPSD